MEVKKEDVGLWVEAGYEAMKPMHGNRRRLQK
jgi:hypothetical protein